MSIDYSLFLLSRFSEEAHAGHFLEAEPALGVTLLSF